MKRYASFWHRAAAWIIDLTLITLVFGLFALLLPQKQVQLLLQPLKLVLPTAASEAQVTPVSLFLIFNIYYVVTNYFYAVFFISATGATPGKLLLGIRVVSKTTNKPPSLFTAIMRESVGKFISGILLELGYLWMFKNAHKQTLHDLLTNTVVVYA
ncbi:TPA: hypothetical protein DIV55_00745 [Patescibacteria group bacterium]|nr:hypothetical protein [Patescibacteria group bacterium]